MDFVIYEIIGFGMRFTVCFGWAWLVLCLCSLFCLCFVCWIGKRCLTLFAVMGLVECCCWWLVLNLALLGGVMHDGFVF